MKGNESFERDELLHKALNEWRVEVPLPPRFQEQVWERIARSQREVGEGVLTTAWKKVSALLMRPAFATAYLTIFLVIGIGAGCEEGTSKATHIKSDLQTRYIQMVDPYKSPR